MKVAVLNDTHAGARNSADLFIEYQRKFYEEVFFPYCVENDIKTVLHLGDYYEHRKQINFKALRENRKHFLEPLRYNGMHMHIICGNHDVFYKNTNDLCAIKELQGYYTDCVSIYMDPTVVSFDGLDIGLVPWINNENFPRALQFLKTCSAPWIAGHFELIGFEMMKGVINPVGMPTTPLRRFESVLSGHFHTKSSQGSIHYMGSQMEFTWADCEDPKYFHVIDTETREIEAVRNPLTLFTKVYYDETKMDYNKDFDVETLRDKFVKVVVVNRTDFKAFDQFIDKIHEIPTHELKVAEDFQEFMGDSVDDEQVSLEDTSVILDTYIDAVETDLNKHRLKSVMRELYIEASNQEIV